MEMNRPHYLGREERKQSRNKFLSLCGKLSGNAIGR